MTIELFYVYTDSCLHCNNFKENHLESLKMELNVKIPHLKLIQLNMKHNKVNYSKIYKYSDWFPNFILFFDRDSINEKISIFNGNIINDKPVMKKIIKRLNSENIIDWCIDEENKINDITNTLFNITTNMNTLPVCFKYIGEFCK